MTRWTLTWRSLRFHARAHAGVLLGAILSAAALTGALLVGESMRQTLLDHALARLGNIELALSTRDRLFLQSLGERVNGSGSQGRHSVALLLPGIVSSQSGARLNQIKVLGVEPSTWPALAQWESTEPQRLGSKADVIGLWRKGEVVLVNQELATRLGIREGDDLVLRIRKPSALSQDVYISPRDESTVALRTKVGFILSPQELGNFSLEANQLAPANVFLPLEVLQQRLGVGKRANLLVMARRDEKTSELLVAESQTSLAKSWQLEDAELSVSVVPPPSGNKPEGAFYPVLELSTSRIFLEPQVVEAALQPKHVLTARDLNSQGVEAPEIWPLTNAISVLTYLANLLEAGDRSTPYSMVTAADTPYVPSGMKDDEVIINEWLARELHVKPGEQIRLSSYVADSGTRLLEQTNSFKIRAIVPIQGIYNDRSLMPEFPGLSKAESTHDWDAGFPLIYPIRPQDEDYWKQHRGTPKAFVTVAAGKRMWASRFGSLTAIRWPVPTNHYALVLSDALKLNLQANLNPVSDFGFSFQPVRDLAIKAATQSQDFGQLFLGFSFFLVVAALLLTALLFQFLMEQRRTEIGTLLATGFTPLQVRRLFLAEGLIISFLGGVLGAVAGVIYAKTMLWALVTHWRSAIGMSVLQFHWSLQSLLIGSLAGTGVAAFTIWLTLRKQARQPAAALLAGETWLRRGAASTSKAAPNADDVRVPIRRHGSRPIFLRRNLAVTCCLICLLSAVLLLIVPIASHTSGPGTFFGASTLLLVAGLAFLSWRLTFLGVSAATEQLTWSALGLRGIGRRRNRSLATIALLACGTFVIVSIGIFRLDSRSSSSRRESGTGGFALIGESTLPILQDLNTRAGREALGLNETDVPSISAVPFRVHSGDDASCLNLNRAQKPRLLGVNPQLLRGRFTFAKAAPEFGLSEGWAMLNKSRPPKGVAASPQSSESEMEVVPAIGDANSIQWALGKSIGDTLDYADERGRVFKLRLVGAVANSILQGSLVIDEDAFIRKFPSESGYRFFLFDAPSNSVLRASSALSRALQDYGLELTTAGARLNSFNAVQNTYLGTFQILGGIGLLLGSAGLGVVVLRNVLERRGELALLVAVGFTRAGVQRLLLIEHIALLGLGFTLGLGSALVAVLPAVLSPGSEIPLRSLAFTLVGVLLNGGLWTWMATKYALQGKLLHALRNE